MSTDGREGLRIGAALRFRLAHVAPTVDAFRALSDDAILSIYMVGPALAARLIAARDTWDDDEVMATFDLLPSGWTSAVGLPMTWRPNWRIDAETAAGNWVGEGVWA